MKKFKLLLLFLLTPLFVAAQISSEDAEELNSRWQLLQSSSLNTAQLTFQHTNVRGTPYLFDDMVVGKIMFQGRWTEQFLGNYDIANNVIKLVRGTEEILIDGFKIDAAVLDDMNLKNNFPADEDLEITKADLMEVIYEGENFSLLRKYNVNLREGQMTYSNATKNEYYDKTDFVALLRDGQYTKTKMKKRDILRLFEDQKKEIDNYAKKNKLKYDEKEDLAKILAFADSL
ncbi:hypothetical protein AB2B38_004725 [Balneola sp. MJW-20]|uniref:hypothetical protein n=1 Tax=Gracilimonas aurantiaca TaxID=3234185 RepID=UPI0034653D0B